MTSSVVGAQPTADEDPAWVAYAQLAQLTVRLFFGAPEYYVMKALLAAPRQKFSDGPHAVLQLDKAIAERLKLDMKYTRKLLALLERDGLAVHYQPKVVTPEGADASAPLKDDDVPVYWGMKFDIMTDAILWKLDAMERRLAQGKKSDLQTYVCPSCGTRTSSLDIDYGLLLNHTTGGISCPTRSMACFGSELVEEDNSQAEAIVSAHRSALRSRLAELHTALRNVAGVPPPTYKKPKPAEEGEQAGSSSGGAAKNSAAGGSGGGGGGGSGGGAGPLTLGASMGIAKAVGSGAAAAAVPWMLSEQQKIKAAQSAKAAAEAATEERASAVDESAAAQWEAEYLRLFEESESGAAAAAAPPPPPPPAVMGADTGAGKKRARDEAAGGGDPGYRSLGPAAAGGAPAPQAAGGEAADDFDEEEGEEETVMVAGVPKPFSEVTEADMARMSDAEYQVYFELNNAE